MGKLYTSRRGIRIRAVKRDHANSEVRRAVWSGVVGVYEPMPDHSALFNIQGQTAVITGGSGGLGSIMARALAEAGVRIGVISLHVASSAKVVEAIRADGGEALGIAYDVMDRTDLERVCTEVLDSFGHIDILINAAGGNSPHATTSATTSFFDLDVHAVD